MEAGRLRQRITIKKRSLVQDGYGEQRDEWSTVATVWASVEPLSGREYLEAQMQQAEVSARIRIRYREGIRPEMQVVDGGVTYEIVSVIHVEERQRELQLMCRQVW